jgi:hypothetical protein
MIENYADSVGYMFGMVLGFPFPRTNVSNYPEVPAMSKRSTLCCLALPLAALVSAAAMAQTPTPRPIAATPLYDPAQLPSFSGKVQQFTLTARGDIDGLILTDGTEVKTPPHLSTAIAYAIRPGDAVTIHGLRAAAIPLLQATSIDDHTTNRNVIDQGPGPGPEGTASGADAAGMREVQGSIRMSLHGARGEINGVLLTDGTVLRLPPDAAISMTAFLQPGRNVVAQGAEVLNPIGKVLEVRAIGTSQSTLTPIDDAPPPGPRGRLRAPMPAPDRAPPPPPPAG